MDEAGGSADAQSANGQLTDAQLVVAARKARTPEQRAEAFGAIAKRHQRTVLAWSGWQLRDWDGAQDVTQSTFEAAFALFAADNGPKNTDKLPQWLIGIAKYRRLEYLRKVRPTGTGPLPGDQTFDELPDDDEARSGRATRAAHVQRLVDRVVATLGDRDRLFYQLRFEQELTGREIAERLQIPEKTASNTTTNLQQAITDGFGALILAQEGRGYCAELAAILDQAAFAGENLTTALRERIVRHFDTCKTCDKCAMCGEKRRELVAPYVPVLIPILLAAIMTDRIATIIQQVAFPQAPPVEQQPPQPPAGKPRKPRRRPKIRKWQALVAGAAVLALLIGGAVVVIQPSSSPAPAAAVHISSAPVASVMPTIAYSVSNTLVLRHGTTPARTLATLPAGEIATQLVWSWNGAYLGWFSGTAAAGVAEVNVTDVASGKTQTWPCATCTTGAFQGGQFLAGSLSASTLAAYPENGGNPTQITITGLAQQGAATTLSSANLIGSTPHDGAVMFFNLGGGNGGWDSELYTTDASGHAAELLDGTINSAPGGDRVVAALGMTATSPDHRYLAYGGNGLGGDVCIGSEQVTVIDLATGIPFTTPLPDSAANPLRISNVWIDSDDIVHAAAWAQPGDCTTAQTPGGTVVPHEYELVDGRWIEGAPVVLAATGPDGWTAQLAGTATMDSNGDHNNVTGPLIATSGKTNVDLPAGVIAFAWAPAPTTASAVAPPLVEPVQQCVATDAYGSTLGDSLPSSVAWSAPLPAGSSVYGTTFNGPAGTFSPYFAAGPAGQTCQSSISQDGSQSLSIGSPGAQVTYSEPGATTVNDTFAFAYFPKVAAALIAQGALSGPCTAPAGQTITPITTSTPDVYLALAHTTGSTSVSLVAAQLTPGSAAVNGQAVDCTMPKSQISTCVASLTYFLTQYGGAIPMSPAALAQAIHTVQQLVTAPTG